MPTGTEILDLYLVSGGADYPRTAGTIRRLFENDGKGNFILIADALPAETMSGGCVRVSEL